MSKIVEKVFCECCDSECKISFELQSTSGFPKFCPFCSEEIGDREKENEENDD